MELDSLFAPRSVAIIGASGTEEKIASRPLRFLLRHGFSGKVVAVNPRYRSIDGVECVDRIGSAPFPIDVALLITPASKVVSIAKECGEAGVKNLVVLSSGFEEAADGTLLASELRDVATHHDMGVVGPNSEGIWSVPEKLVLTFGSAADRETAVRGPVAVLSQSGSIGAALVSHLNNVGIGADYFVSTGNETVLTISDYLEWLLAHTENRVVLCFIEGLSDGRRFLQLCGQARDAGTKVVVLKSGNTDLGRRATASHTGKISSARDVYHDLLSAAGVTVVTSVRDLAIAAAVYAADSAVERDNSDRKKRSSSDTGAGILCISGGSRGLLVDAITSRGLQLATFSEATVARLQESIPSFGVSHNPVDPTGEVVSHPALFEDVLEAIADDPNVTALLIQYANGSDELIARHLPLLQRLRAEKRLPIVVSFLLEPPSKLEVRCALSRLGIAAVADPVDAARVIEMLMSSSAALPVPYGQGAEAASEARLQSWSDVAQMISTAGSADLQVVNSVELPRGIAGAELRETLEQLQRRFPYVLKASPDEVDHKSEAGLVVKGLASVEAVEQELRRMESSSDVSVFLAQEQVRAEFELLVSLSDDPDFGPVMGVGVGGTLVELLSEVRFAALPVEPTDLQKLLGTGTLSRLVGGYRGQTGIDSMRLYAALAQLGDAFVRSGHDCARLELNPVMVAASGSVTVVDALIETRE